MDNKGETVGLIITLFILVILGTVFAVAIANEAAVLSETQSVVNQTITMPNNGTSINLNGQALQGNLVLLNATSNATIPASNYTVSNYQIVDGVITATLTNNDAVWNGASVKATYTYEPYGYNTSSGSRGVARMILLFFVLGIMAWAYAYSGIKDWF